MCERGRFNWVAARASCNEAKRFKELRDVVVSDVQSAKDPHRRVAESLAAAMIRRTLHAPSVSSFVMGENRGTGRAES